MRHRMQSFTVLVLAAALAATAGGVAAEGIRGESRADFTSRPARTGGLDEVIARYSARAEEDPFSAGDRATLAGLYLRRARETGSYQDVLRAEEAARRSLELRSQWNAPTYGVLALSLLEQHRFTAALAAAQQLVADDPTQVGARALLAEIHLELGDYEKAGALFGSLRPVRLHADVAPRMARWLDLTGRDDEARALLYAARDLALRGEVTPERAAWYHLRVGDFELRHGRLDEAGDALDAGLAAFPGDFRLLTAAARLAAARRDWAEALEYGEAVLEQLLDPAVLIVMSDAAQASGDAEKAAEYARVLDVATMADQTPYHRDLGLFLLDRGAGAGEVLRRAEEEIRTRRDVYGYDLLAWAYHRAGRQAEAKQAIGAALRTGARDPVVLYHAGMIERALGHEPEAARFLSEALKANPRFHPIHADAARRALRELRAPWYTRIRVPGPAAEGRGDV